MAEFMAETDKRALERFDLKIPAKIEVRNSEQGEKILDLITRDICSGGAFLYTSQPLTEGINVKLDFMLPLNRLKKLNDDCRQAYIKITGTVLRSESTGMAILFHEDYHIRPWRRE